MDGTWRPLISFLAILNPFALSLYLVSVMEDLDRKRFLRVMLGACLISLVVFCLFALAGEPLLLDVLNVRPAALRAFGGVIFFVVAYQYVVRGYRATEMLRGSAESLPSAVAMPFMIGAGTITQSILIGKAHTPMISIAIIAAGVLVSLLVVMLFKLFRDHLHERREAVFDRYVNLIARANGLLIGAISTDMIVSGLRGLWQGAPTADL